MAAKRRLTTQTDDVARLRNTRIVTSTAELNQITDDIRDAQGAPNEPAPAIRKQPPLAIQLAIYTVGKILRRSKVDR